MNATIIRTTRATYSDLYNKQSFFLQPGTKCFVNPLTYRLDEKGRIVKRMVFDQNAPQELTELEITLPDGKKVTIDYLLPNSQTTFSSTIRIDPS
jgi:hypothetical protein